MASILLTMPERPKSLFMQCLQTITERVVGSESVAEGDRIRCGSALIVGPILATNGAASVLVQWPDGSYQRLAYELRGFAASQKIDGLVCS